MESNKGNKTEKTQTGAERKGTITYGKTAQITQGVQKGHLKEFDPVGERRTKTTGNTTTAIQGETTMIKALEVIIFLKE